MFSLAWASGQSPHKLFWDGADWARLGRLDKSGAPAAVEAKAAYVNGALDAGLYDYLRLWTADSSLADSLFGDPPDYLKTSEIVEGLDRFYGDPSLEYLPVPSAIVIVHMYAERQPLEVIDAFTARTKEWINALTISLQAQDLVRLMAEKQKEHLKKSER